ncbi:uncharacterised protein VP8, partial [Tai Forest reovirus]
SSIRLTGDTINHGLESIAATHDDRQFLVELSGKHVGRIQDLWSRSLPEGWLFQVRGKLFCFIPIDIPLFVHEFYQEKGVIFVRVNGLDDMLSWWAEFDPAERIIHCESYLNDELAYNRVALTQGRAIMFELARRERDTVILDIHALIIQNAAAAIQGVDADDMYSGLDGIIPVRDEGAFRGGGPLRPAILPGAVAQPPVAGVRLKALPPLPVADENGLREGEVDLLAHQVSNLQVQQGIQQAAAGPQVQDVVVDPMNVPLPDDDEFMDVAPAEPPQVIPAADVAVERRMPPVVQNVALQVDVPPLNDRANYRLRNLPYQNDQIRRKYEEYEDIFETMRGAVEDANRYINNIQDDVLTLENLRNIPQAFQILERFVVRNTARLDPFRLPSSTLNETILEQEYGLLHDEVAWVRDVGPEEVDPDRLDEQIRDYDERLADEEMALIEAESRALEAKLMRVGIPVGAGTGLETIRVEYGMVGAIDQGPYIDDYVEDDVLSWTGFYQNFSLDKVFHDFFSRIPDIPTGRRMLARVMRDVQTRVSTLTSVNRERFREPNGIRDLAGVSIVPGTAFNMMLRWSTLSARFAAGGRHRQVCMELARRYAGWRAGARYTIPDGLLRALRNHRLHTYVPLGRIYIAVHHMMEGRENQAGDIRSIVMDRNRADQWRRIHPSLPYVMHIEFWEMFVDWFPDVGTGGIVNMSPIFPTSLSDREVWVAARLL